MILDIDLVMQLLSHWWVVPEFQKMLLIIQFIFLIITVVLWYKMQCIMKFGALVLEDKTEIILKLTEHIEYLIKIVAEMEIIYENLNTLAKLYEVQEITREQVRPVLSTNLEQTYCCYNLYCDGKNCTTISNPPIS